MMHCLRSVRWESICITCIWVTSARSSFHSSLFPFLSKLTVCSVIVSPTVPLPPSPVLVLVFVTSIWPVRPLSSSLLLTKLLLPFFRLQQPHRPFRLRACGKPPSSEAYRSRSSAFFSFFTFSVFLLIHTFSHRSPTLPTKLSTPSTSAPPSSESTSLTAITLPWAPSMRCSSSFRG
jgi:hypothetical protein